MYTMYIRQRQYDSCDQAIQRIRQDSNSKNPPITSSNTVHLRIATPNSHKARIFRLFTLFFVSRVGGSIYSSGRHIVGRGKCDRERVVRWSDNLNQNREEKGGRENRLTRTHSEAAGWLIRQRAVSPSIHTLKTHLLWWMIAISQIIKSKECVCVRTCVRVRFRMSESRDDL